MFKVTFTASNFESIHTSKGTPNYLRIAPALANACANKGNTLHQVQAAVSSAIFFTGNKISFLHRT
jgi:hypothetical protein